VPRSASSRSLPRRSTWAKGSWFYKSTDRGVAVATDRGLLATRHPRRGPEGIVELYAELAKGSEKARAGKLSLDRCRAAVRRLQPGLHRRRGLHPIVNWPDVAILGSRAAAYEPYGNGHEFSSCLMLPLRSHTITA